MPPLKINSGGQLSKTLENGVITISGPSRYLNRLIATYDWSIRLNLRVVPLTRLVGDRVERTYVDGTDGCSIQDATSSDGAKIAILDYLLGGYCDRSLHHNVIKTPSGLLFSIDNEHAFRTLDDYGADWERGGISGFLSLWCSLWQLDNSESLHNAMCSIVASVVDALSSSMCALDVLTGQEQEDAFIRSGFLIRTRSVAHAWILWRRYAYDKVLRGITL